MSAVQFKISTVYDAKCYSDTNTRLRSPLSLSANLSSRLGDRILSKLCWKIEKWNYFCLNGKKKSIFRFSNTIYSKFVEREI